MADRPMTDKEVRALAADAGVEARQVLTVLKYQRIPERTRKRLEALIARDRELAEVNPEV